MNSRDIIELVNRRVTRNAQLKYCNDICEEKLSSTPQKLSIELTKYCPVGCKFCMYESKPKNDKEAENVIYDRIKHVHFMLKSYDLDHLIITGGGEPFFETEKLLFLIRNVKTPLITINTSGYWCSFAKKIDKFMEVFDYFSRFVNGSVLEIRFSIDRFHQESIPLASIYQFIDLFSKNFSSLASGKVLFTFRTNLMTDSVIDAFLEQYVLEVDDRIKKNYLNIILKNNYESKLILAPIFFNDRINRLKYEANFEYVDFYEYMSFASDSCGLFRPFLHKGGLNLTMKPSSDIFNYSGDPNIVCEYPHSDLYRFVQDLTRSKLFLAAHRIGLNGLAEIACNLDKSIKNVLTNTNNFTYIFPLINASRYRDAITSTAEGKSTHAKRNV